MKYFIKKVALSLRFFISFLPSSFSVYISIKGFSFLAKQSPKITFVRKIFDTNLKIFAQSNYAVETQATSIIKNSNDIHYGIKSLNLKDFTMIDVGANVGIYSLAGIYLGAKKVYSFEPGPLYQKLVKNIELNNLNHKIHAFKIAVGSKKTDMKYYEDQNNLGNAILVNDLKDLNMKHTDAKFNDNFINVKVEQLDTLNEMYDFKKIDLIKIDVEGMEYEVIKGANKIITENLPIIVAETFLNMNLFRKNNSIENLFDFLYSHGYQSFQWKNKKFSKFVYPNINSQDTFFVHDVKSYSKIFK